MSRTRRSGPPMLDRQTYADAQGIIHSRITVLSNPKHASGTAVSALLANGQTRRILSALADAMLAGEPVTVTSDHDGGILVGRVSLIASKRRASTLDSPKRPPRISKRAERAAARVVREAENAQAIREARERMAKAGLLGFAD